MIMKQRVKITREQIFNVASSNPYLATMSDNGTVSFRFPDSIEIEVEVPDKDCPNCTWPPPPPGYRRNSYGDLQEVDAGVSEPQASVATCDDNPIIRCDANGRVLYVCERCVKEVTGEPIKDEVQDKLDGLSDDLYKLGKINYEIKKHLSKMADDKYAEQPYKLKAPAIYNNFGDYHISDVTFENEAEAKEMLGSSFVCWPATIDPATGMYKVPIK